MRMILCLGISLNFYGYNYAEVSTLSHDLEYWLFKKSNFQGKRAMIFDQKKEYFFNSATMMIYIITIVFIDIIY